MMIRGPLRYLIGADAARIAGSADHLTMLPYDTTARPGGGGIYMLYGNLLDELYDERRYPPYAKQGQTAEEWHEGQISPSGAGWHRNLDDQFAKAKRLNVAAIELDNADSYHMPDILDALDRARAAGCLVVAKNPLLVEENNTRYLEHPSIIGAICEAGSGTCDGMQALRLQADKPTLPVWWVGNAGDRPWCRKRRDAIITRNYLEMGVTWCPSPEDYSQSVDILMPRPA